ARGGRRRGSDGRSTCSDPGWAAACGRSAGARRSRRTGARRPRLECAAEHVGRDGRLGVVVAETPPAAVPGMTLVYDRDVEQTSVRSWRPQAFGRRNHRDIVDPVIEPLWNGDRVIVRVVRDRADVSDVDGKPITTDLEDILPQLLAAVRAEEVVIDGYLTRQATPPPGTVYLVGSELPTAGQMTSQMLVGRGLRARAMERVESKEKSLDSSNPLAFVAIDLLSVDDESLLDIPLLERKRLLE